MTKLEKILNLNSNESNVYTLLFKGLNGVGGKMTIKELVDRLEISESTVRKCVKKLESLDLIVSRWTCRLAPPAASCIFLSGKEYGTK